jgi:hypothetical protein
LPGIPCIGDAASGLDLSDLCSGRWSILEAAQPSIASRADQRVRFPDHVHPQRSTPIAWR